MKKIITFLACAFFALSSLLGAAQTDKKPAAKNAETKKEVKSDAKPSTEKSNEDKKLKKDGTPDKRYKENKETKPAAGPKKKDGTPDKRYNSNKTK
jgi:preprotein translocase subunit SecG